MAKILIVEDSPTVVSAVEWLLQRNGHRVYTARDGLAALTSVRAFMPDLMLLDIMLPHLDGFELCAMIRQNPAYQTMPIVMMTALKDKADIQRAYDVGADGYVTKPFGEEDLLDAVKQHLAQIRLVEGGAATRVVELDANRRGGDYPR